MDQFRKAKVVRLLTNEGKYLTASEDRKSVFLSENQGAEANANWTVDHIPNPHGEPKFHLWSCYQMILQITSIMGTVRQMKKLRTWFLGWEAKSCQSSTQGNAFRLSTCKCFLVTRDPLKLVLESSVADNYDHHDYKLEWFVEVVESLDDDHPFKSVKEPVKPRASAGSVSRNDQVVEPFLNASLSPLRKCPSRSSNLVVINYHGYSGHSHSAPAPIAYFNSGQNVNGSGTQKNGDINVQYEVTTGRDINVNFK